MADTIAGGVSLLALAIILMQAWGLSLGTPTAPGPGLWPFLVGLGGVVLALIIVAGGILHRRRGKPAPWWRPLVGLASFLLYVPLLESVGYFLPTLALLLFWVRGLGRERWGPSLAIALGVTVVFYFVFAVWLKIPIPVEFR